MITWAVAGLSARLLAESAAAEGWRVAALDLFGDRDTHRAAATWHLLGDPATLRIDPERLQAGLRAAAADGAAGWIAGAGLDGAFDLLRAAEAVLPRVGTPTEHLCRLRDPAAFFGVLAGHGIAYPEVDLRRVRPGWLLKDAGGCGGWHVRVAPAADGGQPLPAGHYAQRPMPGQPVSVTFVANGRDAVVLGVNRQIVAPLAGRPWVFRGVVGPVTVAPAVLAQARRALAALVPAFGVRGLGSLDALLDGDTLAVLEVNARPPASLALYPQVGGAGPLAAHVRAALDRHLPPDAGVHDGPVRATEVLFARRPLTVGAAALATLDTWPGVHDLPAAPLRAHAGDPLCTVSAEGPDEATALITLNRRRETVASLLETPA
jgi:uncharacterized protein